MLSKLKPVNSFSKKIQISSNNYAKPSPLRIHGLTYQNQTFWASNNVVFGARRFCSKKGPEEGESKTEDEGWKGDHEEDTLTEEERKVLEEKRRIKREGALEFTREYGYRGGMMRANPYEVNLLDEDKEEEEIDEDDKKRNRRGKRRKENEDEQKDTDEASEETPSSTKINKILLGQYRFPDPYARFRNAEGKLLDKHGFEIPVNENTAQIPELHPRELDEHAERQIDLSQIDKEELKIMEERERLISEQLDREIGKAMIISGLRGLRSNPLEPHHEAELLKVWKYAQKPNPERIMSTVVFQYNAGTLVPVDFRPGDPIQNIMSQLKFFRAHPDQEYLLWAQRCAIGIAIAIAIALIDALFLDHSEEKDKSTLYFRARLASSFCYTVAGVGATVFFTRLAIKHFLKYPKSRVFWSSLLVLPLYCLSYSATRFDFAEDSSIGKLVFATGVTAACGLGVATHCLKRGTGLPRLLVPLAFSTTALSASLAISPYSFNLEFGTPLIVLSATLAGLFGASAVFPPYRTYKRATLGTIFALTYAGLLLSYQQPYLNRMKFQEKYFGSESFTRDTNLFFKSIFFIPLKVFDVYSDQQKKRYSDI